MPTGNAITSTKEQAGKDDDEVQQAVGQDKKRKAEVLSERGAAHEEVFSPLALTDEGKDGLKTDGVIDTENDDNDGSQPSNQSNAAEQSGGVRKKRRLATPPASPNDIVLPSVYTYHSGDDDEGLAPILPPPKLPKARPNTTPDNLLDPPLQIRVRNNKLFTPVSRSTKH